MRVLLPKKSLRKLSVCLCREAGQRKPDSLRNRETMLNARKRARTHAHTNYIMVIRTAKSVIEFFSINAKFVEAVYLWWYWRKENTNSE